MKRVWSGGARGVAALLASSLLNLGGCFGQSLPRHPDMPYQSNNAALGTLADARAALGEETESSLMGGGPARWYRFKSSLSYGNGYGPELTVLAGPTGMVQEIELFNPRDPDTLAGFEKRWGAPQYKENRLFIYKLQRGTYPIKIELSAGANVSNIKWSTSAFR